MFNDSVAHLLTHINCIKALPHKLENMYNDAKLFLSMDGNLFHGDKKDNPNRFGAINSDLFFSVSNSAFLNLFLFELAEFKTNLYCV